jgi:hypothetical protein
LLPCLASRNWCSCQASTPPGTSPPRGGGSR